MARVKAAERRSRAVNVLCTCGMAITLLSFLAIFNGFRHHSLASARAAPVRPLTPLIRSSRPSSSKGQTHACHPKRLHLAQRSNVYKSHQSKHLINMTISFMLEYKFCRDLDPVVVYGQGMRVQGSVHTQDRKQFQYTSDLSHGLFQSDWIYHVELPHLKAGREEYWYQIQVVRKPPSLTRESTQVAAEQRHLRASNHNSQIVAMTKWYTFFTPPLPHSPTKIALVGDLGQTENSTKTIHHMHRGTLGPGVTISQVLIAGDMAYADSDPSRWNLWFDLMEPLARATPVHVASGNHEIECDTTTLRPFGPYENYFYNPNRIREANIKAIPKDYKETLWHQSCAAPSELLATYDYGNAFYSYQHGLAHIIVLNSYSNSTKGSVQYKWLVQELKHRVDRKLTPWLLVAFHSPLYTTFVGHVNEQQAINMKQAMEPLFGQYGVNIVISGHDHGYMRTHSMKPDGTVDASNKSPVYLTVGAAGNREQHAPGFRQDEPEDWVAVRTLVDYGYGNLFLRNATHGSFTWVRDGIDAGGVQDIVWLENKHYER